MRCVEGEEEEARVEDKLEGGELLLHCPAQVNGAPPLRDFT